MDTDSILGREVMTLGPSNAYYDTATGGINKDLGGFDSLRIGMQIGKTGLRKAQGGDQDSDKVVTSQIYTVAMGLAEASLERLELVEGIELERDTLGNIIQVSAVNVLGRRDSSGWKQLTVKEIIDGLEATEENDPLHILDFFLSAPMNDSIELTYDAASQRYFPFVFNVYLDKTKTASTGRAKYYSSRIVVP